MQSHLIIYNSHKICKLLFHELLKTAEDAEAVSKLEKLFHALLASTSSELDSTEQAMETHRKGKLGEIVDKCVAAEGPDF